jgi:uncharacterized protein YjbI with pentapeptide repeats
MRQVARARTITALRRLDGTRNALLTQFLSSAKLLPVIDLSAADLYATDLRHADLSHADLRYVYLRYADVQFTLASGTLFTRADLLYADLFATDLRDSYLFNPDWGSTVCPDGTNSDTNGTIPHSCLKHLEAAGP